ncbi:phosphopantothenoylcysteine decarboxylase [Rhizobium sp. BK176]|uniref:phosphopantothenoylcysteine decarboxylase domain-containing protein n=1 Tax=Rhizobium sp. BK176 TaxID=2587071 RepID=UPI0021698D32|nr:phosphopantothenoylcysteine decarboxylase [Rhizobium sp. BK176]MCS4089283.1 phosphopantothenoylcysteine synthetase/decarboxylase [Rhizobium sp. BK176]
MASPAEQSFRGKRILVVGGSPRESIDGVRHYANHKRDQSHGARAAAALVALGASVTFVSVNSSTVSLPSGAANFDTVNGSKIVCTKELLAACAKHNSEPYDAIVQLANIPSVIPVQPSEHKLKVKSEEGVPVFLDVVANIDVIMRLRWMFPKSAVLGYDNRQQWFEVGNAALVHDIRTVVSDLPGQSTPTKTVGTPAVDHTSKPLSGRKVVVTSGPTAEPITAFGDVMTNFSSGRQGHAIAEALAGMGAEVVLVSGPTSLREPSGENIRTVHVSSAMQMHRAVMAELPADVFVGVAAVADFASQQPHEVPIKEGEFRTLELCQNPDILRSVGNHASLRPSVVVGFAAETHDVLAYARDKLSRKGADFICANQVGEAVASRGPGVNEITMVTPMGDEVLPELSKLDVGKVIGSKIAQLLAHQTSAAA